MSLNTPITLIDVLNAEWREMDDVDLMGFAGTEGVGYLAEIEDREGNTIGLSLDYIPNGKSVIWVYDTEWQPIKSYTISCSPF